MIILVYKIIYIEEELLNKKWQRRWEKNDKKISNFCYKKQISNLIFLRRIWVLKICKFIEKKGKKWLKKICWKYWEIRSLTKIRKKESKYT